MTSLPQDRIFDTIDSYYSEKILTHGATPRGVDWNGVASQRLRYEQLARLLPMGDFSVCDLGCGYGGFYDFLVESRSGFRYEGVDISAEMVAEAERLHPDRSDCRFARSGTPTRADFVVASGIFNVRPGIGNDEWRRFVFGCIHAMDAMGDRGFAFNCLTSFSDHDRMRDYLFYVDPSEMFSLAMGYSRNVALLHDYGLYEFTVIVRKDVRP